MDVHKLEGCGKDHRSWTSEPSQKWIYDMTPYMETRKEELIPATLESVSYDGKLWGMPQQTNAAFLFYRTDQVSQAPETWPYEGVSPVYPQISQAIYENVSAALRAA
jgi:ABC-type glycerol-3-phosphate transport system substrate-binding protein